MKISYGLKGKERKVLVTAISQELNTQAKYLGTPSYGYQIGEYNISREGILTGEDNRELVIDLFARHSIIAVSEEYDNEPQETPDEADTLEQAGEEETQTDDVAEPEYKTYRAELYDPNWPDRMEVFSAENDEDAIKQAYEFMDGEVTLLELFELDGDYNELRGIDFPPNPNRLTIEHPLTGFTPEKLDNLNKMVTAKAPLLKAALGAEKLPIIRTNESLLFPWFSGTIDAEHTEAYATLISLLCKTALEKKRVTAKEKEIEGSPKFAMRVWLLSLGFIGPIYKSSRKILLSKLEGSGAFKNGERKRSAGETESISEPNEQNENADINNLSETLADEDSK